jgi:membrane associated rhomboid family serine protease
MFPLRDDNPQLTPPIAVIALITLNALVWMFVQSMGTEPALSRTVCELGLIPGELLGLVRRGTRIALSPELTCVLGLGASWYTMLTSMFLHGSWFHLIGNMWFLWVFGGSVEDATGHARFVIFYLVCGIAAAAAQIASNTHSPVPMVGASGAIGGVMGGYLVLHPRARVETLLLLGFLVRMVRVPAWVMLGYWFLLQFLGGLPALGSDEPGVAFAAHVGGFLAGMALIVVFRNPRSLMMQQRLAYERY